MIWAGSSSWRGWGGSEAMRRTISSSSETDG